MNKLCQHEKCNHHFPELMSKRNLLSYFANRFNLKNSSVLMVIAIFGFGFVYLAQTNLTATRGYQIKTLEKQLAQLQQENNKLTLDYIALQSTENVIKEAGNLQMVPTTEAESLTLNGSAVALR